MKKGHYLWIILLLSVALRVGIALYFGDVVDAPSLLTDQRSYHWLGARIAAGEGYSFPSGWYPFTPAETPTAHWSFLYPLFVAAVYRVFGVHPLAVRCLQAVLGGILLPWMVYRLARTLFNQDANVEAIGVASPYDAKTLGRYGAVVPLLAALWAAVYPYFAMYSATLMTETFYIVALLWSLEVALRMGRLLRRGERVTWRVTVQLGLSLGIAAVLRQSILPWAPVLFLWLMWQATRSQVRSRKPRVKLQTSVDGGQASSLRRSLTPLVAAGLILIGCIVPWTIRNYVVYGEFLLLNSNTGYAMYSAQHPMHGTNFREFDAAPLPEDLPRGNEAQMDRDLMARGIQFVLNDPVRYLRLSLSRVRAYFEFWPTPDTTRLHNLGRVGSFGIALPFMVYGIAVSIQRASEKAKKRASEKARVREGEKADERPSHIQRPLSGIEHPASAVRVAAPDLVLILLFMAFYSALHIFTWAMVRYRLPVDAVAMPFAALAVCTALEPLNVLTFKR